MTKRLSEIEMLYMFIDAANSDSGDKQHMFLSETAFRHRNPTKKLHSLSDASLCLTLTDCKYSFSAQYVAQSGIAPYLTRVCVKSICSLATVVQVTIF